MISARSKPLWWRNRAKWKQICISWWSDGEVWYWYQSIKCMMRLERKRLTSRQSWLPRAISYASKAWSIGGSKPSCFLQNLQVVCITPCLVTVTKMGHRRWIQWDIILTSRFLSSCTPGRGSFCSHTLCSGYLLSPSLSSNIREQKKPLTSWIYDMDMRQSFI